MEAPIYKTGVLCTDRLDNPLSIVYYVHISIVFELNCAPHQRIARPPAKGLSSHGDTENSETICRSGHRSDRLCAGLHQRTGPQLDKAGAAALLNVSVRTVESWIAQRRIPFVKMGEGPHAAVRFRAPALQEWIESQEVKADEVKADEVKGALHE